MPAVCPASASGRASQPGPQTASLRLLGNTTLHHVCLLTCLGQLAQKFAVESWRDAPSSLTAKLFSPWLILAVAPLRVTHKTVPRDSQAHIQGEPRVHPNGPMGGKTSLTYPD